MGFCGTDMIHHLDFLKKAEDYRRVLIKALNDKHAYGGSKTGDWKWTVDSEFFKSVQGFTYETPRISNHLNHYLIDLLFLFCWALLIKVLIRVNAVKVNVMKSYIRVTQTEIIHLLRSPFKTTSILLFVIAIIFGSQNGYQLLKRTTSKSFQ